jgi:SdrD B-like domain/Secretion system C-terminal sorting domain
MNNFTKLLVLLCSVLLSNLASAQISGTVYRDYNGNGTRQNTAPYIEPGVQGVIVTAYNANDAVVNSTTTAANGTYSLAYSVQVRLEFTLPANGTVCGLNSLIDYSSFSGEGNSVRFVSVSGTTQNYGINNPADYNTGAANAFLFTPTLYSGTTQGGTSATKTGFVGFPYSNINATLPSRTLNASNIGTTWGLAYSKQAKKMFAAAFIKRHAGLKGSSGQIFLISNLTSGTMSSVDFFDMDKGIDGIAGNADDIPTRWANVPMLAYGSGTSYSIAGTATTNPQTITYLPASPVDPLSGLPRGLGVVGTNAQRGLNDNQTLPTNDPAAFGQVGRVGLGDIEISDDGRYLFVTNLYDRKIYRLTLDNAAAPTAVTAVTAIVIPNPPLRSTRGTIGAANFASTYTGANDNTGFYDGTRGYQRPFALKYYRGKLYIGTTTTGEIAGTTTTDNNTGNPEYTDLWSYVWECDDAGNFTSSPLVQEPLNFNRGTDNDLVNETWGVWTNSMPNPNTYYTKPQPMFMGIEFDETGAMILGFQDRLGNQGTTNNYALTGTTNLNIAVAFGDLLRATKNAAPGCGFTFERNGNGVLNGTNNGGGPSNYNGNNGEFYWRDNLWNANTSTCFGSYCPAGSNHINTGLAGLAFLAGTPEISTTSMDPYQLFSGGISKFNNTTGDNTADYQIYNGNANPGDPSKSNGLGDLELVTETAPIEIGNRVWNDVNGDGIQNPGESSLANVTLELFLDANDDGVPDGAAVGTVTTDANGNYYFTSAAGTDVLGTDYGVTITYNQNYIIRVAASDWNSATGAGIGDLAGLGITRTDKIGYGAVDLSDNDAALTIGTVIVPQVRFTTGLNGQNNHNIDFGFKALTSLGDKVWRDDNTNGIQDTGEPGVAGVAVTLYNNSGAAISTTVTDAYGNYLFDNLAAGTYQIGVTPPANYSFTTQTNDVDNTTLTGGATAANGSDVNAITGRTANIVLVAGENEKNIDAGLIFSQPATNSIGDRVWFDSDGNGSQNGTEPGVSGVTIILYASDGITVVATTVTDANGNYIFTGLPASTNYIISITPPVGMIPAISSGTTEGNATVNSDVSQTTLKTTAVNTGAAGTQITGIDAGLIQQAVAKASLGDKVWLDLSGGAANVQDANEPWVAGITVELLDGTGLSIDPDGAGPLTKTETVTDAFGNYIFNNLNAAGYKVKFTLPAGYTFVTQNTGTDDFKDSDPNFATGITATYTLAAGQRNVSVDAGLTQTAPAGSNRLGDKVWFDANSNGTQDAGEVGVAGVTVTLYNNLGAAIATTTTDANGNYLFVNLADGTYSVGFGNIPARYSLSPIWTSDAANATNSDANPGTGRTGPIVVNGGVTENDVDAGLIAGTASGLGSIGNKVWWDLNGGTANVQDTNEPGVAGVTVTLLDAGLDGIVGNADDGASGATTTNALGEYIFTGLPASNYAVQFSNLPAGASVVTSNSGTDDNIDSDGLPLGTGGAPAGASRTAVYNLAIGQDNLTVDLGISNAAKGSYGDRVWYDNGAGGGVANDGILNGTEIGVAGVTVTLVNAAGQTIDRTGTVTTTPITTTTDANGYYAFADLTATVSFAAQFSNLPAGFNFSIKAGTGGADNNRSDADLINGLTPTVAIVANTHNTTLDAGIISSKASLGSYVWLDTNGDGIQDITEAGVPGVTVTLYRPGFGLDGIAGNADDALPVTSMITNQSGAYLFANLIPGTYQVEFSSIPGGLSFTKQNTPGDNADNTNSDAIPTATNSLIGTTGNIVLTAGEVDVTIDAGLFKPRAVIGNYIWIDANVDGIQQAAEQAAPGILVSLLDGGGNPVAVAISDASGFYMFPNVAPGTYSLSFANLPSSVSFTTPNLGGDDNLDSDVTGTTITGIVVTTTTVNLSFDAGLVGFVTLPVRIEFTAVKSGSTAVLTWKVYADNNVKNYTLERSADGTNFTRVVTYTADGRTEYNKIDAQPVSGLNYYRVRIENPDGKIEYSEVRIVLFGSKGTINVFPNPSADRINVLLPESWQNKAVTIDIIDQLGRVVIKIARTQAGQIETINISKLSNAAYLLRMINNKGEQEVRKIQVNK